MSRMKVSEFVDLFKKDLERYILFTNKGNKKYAFLKALISAILGVGPSQAVLLYRLSRWFLLNRVPFIHYFFTKLNMVLNGAEISAHASIGPGFFIAHPQGVVIGQNVRCSKNLMVFQNVTIGAKNPFDGKEEMPIIGENVTLYAGCKVLGQIIIGQNVRIGANVVVTNNVESNSTVVIDKTIYRTV